MFQQPLPLLIRSLLLLHMMMMVVVVVMVMMVTVIMMTGTRPRPGYAMRTSIDTAGCTVGTSTIVVVPEKRSEIKLAWA